MLKVERLFKLGAAALVVACLSSCSRVKSGSSSLTIQLPSKFSSSSNKTSSQNVSTLSFNASVVCFAVNVTGNGIPQYTPSCAPPIGVFSGFKPPGATISMQVESGTGRKLELFAFNRRLSSDPCPTDITSVGADQMSRVGEVDNIDMTQPEVTVSVDAYSNPSNVNMVTQYSLPGSCVVGAPAGEGSRQQVVLGAARLTSPSYSIQGQVTFKQTFTELHSTNYKMLLGPKGL